MNDMEPRPWSVTPDQRDRWIRALDEAQALPAYVYPWTDLDRVFAQGILTHVPIVVYGSLINAASARRTLPAHVVNEARPVVAAGVRRIFDYRMPDSVSAYGRPRHPRACAALNVHVTRDLADLVNGLLVRLSREALPAFRDREAEYDLVPVACFDWADPRHPFPAYILRSETRADGTLLPHKAYYLVCRRGAAAYGEAFLRFWLETTYLGDGKTSVKEWERRAFPNGIPAPS